jgi:ATP-dependent Clp protease ATP-binding subunit ClpC
MRTIQSESTPLKRYGHNLTLLAHQRAFTPLNDQEAVMDRVFQVLQRTNKCNPVILDRDETRRWAVVAEVIRRMAVGNVPYPFSTYQVLALDYEALFTNLSDDTLAREERRRQRASPLVEKLAQTDPDSEEAWALRDEIFRWSPLEEWIAPTMVLERLQSLFLAIQQEAGPFLLFVDHFHRLLGGEWDRYPIDAATLLKPVLARRQIQLIGTCTLEQYQQYIERDAAMQRRCQEICLPGNWQWCIAIS